MIIGVYAPLFCSEFLFDHLKRESDLHIAKLAFYDVVQDITHTLYGWAGVQPRIHYRNQPGDANTLLTEINTCPAQLFDTLRRVLLDHDNRVFDNLTYAAAKKLDIAIITDVHLYSQLGDIQAVGGKLIGCVDGSKKTPWPWDFVLTKLDDKETCNAQAQEISDIILKELDDSTPES